MYAGAMSKWTMAIIARLTRVQDLRHERDADPSLLERVVAVKRFQHARFTHDYAALLVEARYCEATRVFLEGLYGPEDFAARDAQFERVIPWMARVLPEEVMCTIANLIELHSLTEELDQQMAAALNSANLDDRSYRGTWGPGRATRRSPASTDTLVGGGARP